MPRRLGFSLRTVRYHLDRLEGDRLAQQHRAGRFVRWFQADVFSVSERALISAARVRGQRIVLHELLSSEGLRWMELLAATGLSKASLSWHLRSLCDSGILAWAPDGLYHVTDRSGVAMALALQIEQIGDELADAAREVFDPPR